jgi:serine/threonine protein kinase
MKITIRNGAWVGGWQIIGDKPLGEGGNSVVWKAKSDKGDEVAIKFLFERHFGNSRYYRFVDEIAFLENIGSRKGIVPLVDSYLPDTPSKTDRPWLATQLATPLTKSLDEMGGDLWHTVESIQIIATTLKRIHEEGGAHRDIKPDNLFYLNGVPAIGDFGLVSYPGKEPVTSTSERIGSLYYIAPEMMINTDNVDPKPADVYSLAKTLWVLASGQRFPLQGEIRTDIPQARLSTYVQHDRALILDLLLEKSTRHDPNNRPTISEFAAELSAWLKPTLSVTVPDLSHLSARFSPLRSQVESAKANRTAKYEQAAELVSTFHKFLKDQAARISETTGFKTQVLGNTNHMLHFFQYPLDNKSRDMHIYKQNCNLECGVTSMSGSHIVFNCGFVFYVDSDGQSTLTGGYVIVTSKRKPKIICEATIRFSIGTAQQSHKIEGLLNDLKNALPEALDTFADVIDDPEKLAPK